MKLTLLGTGNATVTECYNTCFTLGEGTDIWLIDGGGGNEILKQLKRSGIDWKEIKNIFVTHKHIDHILGIIWMIRMIGQNMSRGSYEGDVTIYAHEEVIRIIQNMAEMLLNKKEAAHIGGRIQLSTVEDGETYEILGCPVTFFDICSTKAKQYGFTMKLPDGERLTCCGDEPYNEQNREYIMGSKWLLHEAFCLYSEADVFKPYEKHHSTVKDACELAAELEIENLILYHTEDRNICKRKELYRAEGQKYFDGNLFVPDDLEKIKIT